MVRTFTLSFLCNWSYGVVLYEIFTVGKLTIVIIYDLFEAHCQRLVRLQCTLKALSSAVAYLSRKEAGKMEKDIRLLLFLFGYPQGVSAEERALNMNWKRICAFLIRNQSYSIFQVVLRIRECMAGKLLAHFKKDTGCLSHNTWMTKCKRFYIFKNDYHGITVPKFYFKVLTKEVLLSSITQVLKKRFQLRVWKAWN